ncbi:MAG: glutamate-1-semialdehyde 2,1-aminomutase [Acidaminococcaceae bacterium]|nr:glutamate-1-semialdehyde 2,1-aminomutase [Acidaminococcaceae bacterium]
MDHSKSQAAFAEAKQYIPGGVNSPVRSFRSVGGIPPVIAKGSGSKLTDIDGNEYIDYVLSYGPLLLGHAHPQVTTAIQEAAARGSSYGAPTLAETELANLLCQLVPSMEMVRMVNSGTEATMSALRLARAYTGRENIVKFIGCYHGHHDSLLVKAGSGAATLGVPDSPGVPKGVAANTITVPFNDQAALEAVFAAQGDTIAAVIMEPTPGNMGLVLPQDGYLEFIRSITEKYGALLICDEVMSGFRSSEKSSQGLYGIDPDITCLGKVIGGGLPVAAYGGKRKIMEQVAPVGPMYQAGTLSGNPLAMAAGIANLTYMREQHVCSQLESMTAILSGGLVKAAAQAGVPVQVHRLGSMFTVFFTAAEVYDYDSACTSDLEAFRIYFHSMLEQGIYLPPSQFETNFLSLAHTPEDIEKTLQAAAKAFAAVAAARN